MMTLSGLAQLDKQAPSPSVGVAEHNFCHFFQTPSPLSLSVHELFRDFGFPLRHTPASDQCNTNPTFVIVIITKLTSDGSP